MKYQQSLLIFEFENSCSIFIKHQLYFESINLSFQSKENVAEKAKNSYRKKK